MDLYQITGMGKPIVTGGVPLLDLPNELLNEIASYLPAQDLRTLRLVSQAIHIVLNTRINNTCFSEPLAAFWFPASLDKMLRIIEHPRLGTWVTGLTFYLDRPASAAEKGATKCIDGCDRGCMQNRELLENFSETLELIEECSRPHGGKAIEYLDRIFTSYAERCIAAGTSANVYIKAIDGEGVPAPLRRFAGDAGCISAFSTTDSLTAVTTILESMDRTSLTPGRLDFGLGSSPRNFSVPAKWFQTLPALTPANLVFSHLTALGLALQATPEQDDMPRREGFVQSLAAFIRTIAPHLRAVCLSDDRNTWDKQIRSDTRYTTELLLLRLNQDAVYFPVLREVALQYVHIDEAQLVQFLARHSALLKRTMLCWCYLYKGFPADDLRRQEETVQKLWKIELINTLASFGLPPVVHMDTVRYGRRLVG